MKDILKEKYSGKATKGVLFLKKQLKVRHFSSDVEIIATVETWLDGQLPEFFFERLAKVRATG